MLPKDNSHTYKLIEGQSYQFEIKKLIDISGSCDLHYVLHGPDDKKYLLDAGFYDHYSLHPGMKIMGKIDKINCTGRIFIEPDHPYYEVGKSYDFQLVKIAEEKNIMSETIFVAWVRDILDKEWKCIIKKPLSLELETSTLPCRVDRIKKARLYLSQPDMHVEKTNLLKGSIYDFIIFEIRELSGEEFYILKDKFGVHHMLEKKNYLHFGYTINQSIKARVVDIMPDGLYKLEPNNPYYKLGEVFMFRFISKEAGIKGEYEGQDGGICLEDHFGKQVKVKAKSWQLEKNYHFPEYLPCRVLSFKKGRTVLENVAVNSNGK